MLSSSLLSVFDTHCHHSRIEILGLKLSQVARTCLYILRACSWHWRWLRPAANLNSMPRAHAYGAGTSIAIARPRRAGAASLSRANRECF